MNKFVLITTVILALLGFVSCHKDEPKSIEPSRTVLIYAVASNNLSSYLAKDVAEMIEAAPSIPGLGKNIRVLLYSVASQNATQATLAELSKNADQTWTFRDLKSYDRSVFSTDPVRMKQVYADVAAMAPADNFGLVFWSHGTGWLPEFKSHEVPGLQKSFGWDSYQNVTDKCDIIELADAIPDRMFDYIWFDACYMMGIEVAYQLRRKCDFIGGYPTEDWNPGMNYDQTLPCLASATPDLEGAAQAFFDYYNSANMAVTVSLISTDGLENLAAVTAEIYATGTRPTSAYGFQDYGRSPYRGLYDFGQFTRAYLSADNDAENAQLLADFDAALGSVLAFGGCSSKDFYGNTNAFDPDIYSGMSCHFPDKSSEEEEEYFRQLDWTIATNP